MELKPYIVTDLAGRYVAGKRVKAGQRIELTARQAKYELDRGMIRPADVEPMPPMPPKAA
jgi:hypothetical protein